MVTALAVRVAFTPSGHLTDAPEQVALHPAVLAAWARHGIARRHCATPRPPCAHPWDGRCTGHADAEVRPGDRIVLGRPGSGRAVYTVTAAGTGGTRLEREA